MSETIQVPCAACGAPNRVPPERLGDGPRCGRCKEALAVDRPAALGAKAFDGYVKKSGLPVLVDFWAPWCGPCRAMAPQFELAAKKLAGKALLAKVNTEDAPQLGARFSIQAIPTMVLLRGGEELGRKSGALDAKQIAAWAGGVAAGAAR